MRNMSFTYFIGEARCSAELYISGYMKMMRGSLYYILNALYSNGNFNYVWDIPNLTRWEQETRWIYNSYENLMMPRLTFLFTNR